MRLAFVLALALAITSSSCSRAPSSDTPVADAAPVVKAAAAAADASTEAPPRCEEQADVHVFVAPATPSTAAPLRVLATSDRPLAGELRVESGGASAKSDVRHGGPPYFWIAEVAAPKPGSAVATFAQRACEPGRAEKKTTITVAAHASPTVTPPKEGVWGDRQAWSRPIENVYSAWIETLFDAPDDEMPSWPALHEVLRDPKTGTR